MKDVKCFFLEPTNKYKISYRAYVSSDKCKCSNEYGYHNYSELIEYIEADEFPVTKPMEYDETKINKCSCGYEFKKGDTFQRFVERVYVDKDGKEYLHREFPVGAMFYSDWLNDIFPGPDGRCLTVITPGGEWNIDGRASNCTMPEDKIHRCWVRHGTPPNITVDKNGNTCRAGAGSIAQKNYHGFLRNGFLTNCP